MPQDGEVTDSATLPKAALAVGTSCLFITVIGCVFIHGYWSNAGVADFALGRSVAFAAAMFGLHLLGYALYIQQMGQPAFTSPAQTKTDKLAVESETTSAESCGPALKAAIAQHVVFLVLTALLLDGGIAFQHCRVNVAAHWAIIIVVLIRRFRRPTQIDKCLIKYGFVPLGIAVGAFAPVVHRLLGH